MFREAYMRDFVSQCHNYRGKAGRMEIPPYEWDTEEIWVIEPRRCRMGGGPRCKSLEKLLRISYLVAAIN